MEFVINPFISAGNLNFGTNRKIINKDLNSSFKSLAEKTLSGAEFVTDHYGREGLVLGYLDSSFLLRYVVLTDPCEAIFENEDLLAMNYGECLAFTQQFDNQTEEEEYVGFKSYKYGIAVYAPDGTDNPECSIEAVTVGEKGYFHP